MNNIKFFALFTLAFIQFSCTSQIVKLSPKEFFKKITEEKQRNIVDVRTPEEHKGGFINFSDNIDWNSPEFEEFFSRYDRNTPVFIYCLSGGRSHNAALKAKELGFKKVYELEGGMMAWRSENLPEIKPNGEKASQMTSEEFKKLYTGKKKKVLIDFYATWCMPCMKMKPALEAIQKQYSEKVEIIRIDADQHPELLKQMGVEGLPTIIIYENNKEKIRKMGYIGEQELRSLVNE